MGFDIDLTDSRNSVKKQQKVVKTTKVTCNECSRKLGQMLEVLPSLKNNIEIKHIYVCPCGGESFTVKVKHSAYFLSEEGLSVTSIADVGTNKYKSTLETHDGE